jgi:hypothetical protein
LRSNELKNTVSLNAATESALDVLEILNDKRDIPLLGLTGLELIMKALQKVDGVRFHGLNVCYEMNPVACTS